jgi:hypothetical protein
MTTHETVCRQGQGFLGQRNTQLGMATRSKAQMKVVEKLYTDGRRETGNWKMDLQEMQEFVGGYIEMVPTRNPRRALVVNEDGLMLDLPNNVAATALVRPGTMVLGLIRGNALVVKD